MAVVLMWVTGLLIGVGIGLYVRDYVVAGWFSVLRFGARMKARRDRQGWL